LCKKKRFGPAQATFFTIFELNAGLCANVCGNPQPESGLCEPLEACWELLGASVQNITESYRILRNPGYVHMPQERPAALCRNSLGARKPEIVSKPCILNNLGVPGADLSHEARKCHQTLHLEPSGTPWSRSGPGGPEWELLGASVSFWEPLGPSGSLWEPLGVSKPFIWSHLGVPGADPGQEAKPSV
jgi:hypothetical protein